MKNWCRCSQDGVTHICELRVGCWEQGGWATQDARRVGVGNPCHSTSSCHWTHDKTQGTSLRENSSSREQERIGKWGQIRAGDHAMCHLPCSLMFSKIQCYYAGLYKCYNVYNMKFTILTILSIQPSGTKYIHIVVQPSPPSISTTLSSPQHSAHFTAGQVPPKTNDPSGRGIPAPRVQSSELLTYLSHSLH